MVALQSSCVRQMNRVVGGKVDKISWPRAILCTAKHALNHTVLTSLRVPEASNILVTSLQLMEHRGVQRDAGACPGELIFRLVQGQCSPRGERCAGQLKKGHNRALHHTLSTGAQRHTTRGANGSASRRLATRFQVNSRYRYCTRYSNDMKRTRPQFLSFYEARGMLPCTTEPRATAMAASRAQSHLARQSLDLCPQPE